MHSPAITGAIALLGGTVAAGSHATKAGTRVAANTSPEPFSNWFLSLGEDAFVIGLSFIALKYPLLALGVSVVILLLIVFDRAIDLEVAQEARAPRNLSKYEFAPTTAGPARNCDMIPSGISVDLMRAVGLFLDADRRHRAGADHRRRRASATCAH